MSYDFSYRIPYATVEWSENGTPRSPSVGDLYYSDEDGLAESEYVFLTLNDLPRRWQRTSHFTIAELGFGTGLNFLATVDSWLQTRQSGQRLTYVSFEKEPVSIADMQRAHARFSVLGRLRERLYTELRWLHVGPNLIRIRDWDIDLLLVIGPAEKTLPQLRFTASAWFLDGFAPAQNSSMWNGNLAREIAAHSAPGTTAATFSASRLVKDSLSAAGFTIVRVAGFGRKRHSLRAEFTRTRSLPHTVAAPETAAIVGGGLAGCLTAAALTERGVHVSLFEAHSALAAGASGNPVGMAKPDFSAVPDTRAELSVAGFTLLRRLCAHLDPDSEYTRFNGIYRSPRYGRLQRFMELFAELQPDPWLIRLIDEAEVMERTGLPLDAPGLLYPSAGWVRPTQLCQRLASSAAPFFNQRIVELIPRTSGWQLRSSGGALSPVFDAIILATSAATPRLLGQAVPGMTHNHGRIFEFEAASFAAPTIPVIGPGYAIAPDSTSLIVGATYEHDDSTETKERTRTALLRDMEAFCGFTGLSSAEPVSVRRSLRCNTADRLPIMGPWHSELDLQQCFSECNKPSALTALSQLESSGIFLATSLGSKGLTLGPVLAETLAALICNEPYISSRRCVNAMLAARFPLRAFLRQ